MGNLNIRLKLGLLILITVIPTVVFISFNIFNQYKTAKDNSLSNLKQVANTFSAEQSQTIEGARQLLIGLSTAPSVKSLESTQCSNYLNELIQNYKRYANFGVADIEGNVICSAVTANENVNVKDKEFFKKAYKDNNICRKNYFPDLNICPYSSRSDGSKA